MGAHIDPKYTITSITVVIKGSLPIRFDISPQILGHMPCALLLAPGRYCRHCGSRSAAEMGGDMRSVGSHLGATVVPVSLRQGAARTIGGNPRRQKNARRRCGRQLGGIVGQATAISRRRASSSALEGEPLTVMTF